MLVTSLLRLNVAVAQVAEPDCFVMGEGAFVYPNGVIYTESVDQLLASPHDDRGNYVWVQPSGPRGAVVDYGTTYPEVFDLDGDGRDELYSLGVDVARGGPDVFRSLPSGSRDFRYDYDGDGRAEVLSESYVAFSDGVEFLAADFGWGRSDLVPTGDLDGDGRDDLIRVAYDSPEHKVRPYGRGGVAQHVGNGTAGLEAHYELHLGADLADGAWPARWSFRPDSHPAVRASAVADVDGDGAADLLAWVQSEDLAVYPTPYVELAVFTDLLGEPREAGRGWAVAGGDNNPRLLPVGDWDRDGDEDVYVLMGGLGAERELTHVVDGDPADPLAVVASFAWSDGAPEYSIEAPSRAYVGDFDGDRNPDLAVVRPRGVAFYGVDPSLLQAEPESTLLGGCGLGGSGAAAFVGVGLLGWRRRRAAK